MKSIRSLIMIAICMIVFTSTAVTAKTEQKSQCEFVKDISPVATAVFTANDYSVVSVYADATIKTEFKVKSFEQNEPITYLAIITDVGWRSSNRLFNKIIYREKLQENLFTNDNPTRYCRSNC